MEKHLLIKDLVPSLSFCPFTVSSHNGLSRAENQLGLPQSQARTLLELARDVLQISAIHACTFLSPQSSLEINPSWQVTFLLL